jgi:hypothetical protein
MSAAQSGTRRAPSPALVVAMLALVLTLGGTGYAASQTGAVKLVYRLRKSSVIGHIGQTFTVDCPNGTRPTGGGFSTTPATDVVLNSGPFDSATNSFAGGSVQSANGWRVSFYNHGSSSSQLTIYAVCAPS